MGKRVRCLVIGANGFVGSHLVDELAESGYDVRAFDRYSRPAQFKTHEAVEVFKADVFNPEDTKRALKGVDYVFHSLSLTTPATSEDDPYSDIEKNLKPSVRIFEQCVAAKVKKVIFISSGGAVYGSVAEDETPTEKSATAPVSPYGINKLAIEHYLSYFHRKFGLEYLVYRLTNPYGPRQTLKKNQGVIPAFIQQLREDKELTVFGDGSAARDYIYIRDVTKMIAESFAKQTRHRTYNLGSGEETAINQIIEALHTVAEKEVKVSYLESPKTFLKHARVSVDRFVEEFGAHASTDLVKGLKQTFLS